MIGKPNSLHQQSETLVDVRRRYRKKTPASSTTDQASNAASMIPPRTRHERNGHAHDGDDGRHDDCHVGVWWVSEMQASGPAPDRMPRTPRVPNVCIVDPIHIQAGRGW